MTRARNTADILSADQRIRYEDPDSIGLTVEVKRGNAGYGHAETTDLTGNILELKNDPDDTWFAQALGRIDSVGGYHGSTIQITPPSTNTSLLTWTDFSMTEDELLSGRIPCIIFRDKNGVGRTAIYSREVRSSAPDRGDQYLVLQPNLSRANGQYESVYVPSNTERNAYIDITTARDRKAGYAGFFINRPDKSAQNAGPNWPYAITYRGTYEGTTTTPYENLFFVDAKGGCFASEYGNTTSYRRFKSGIKTIENGLELAEKLNPRHYYHKKKERWEYGFVIEELEESGFNEMIQEVNEEGDGGYFPDQIIPILTKAVQELTQEVKDLKKQVAELSSK